jgi:SAM-dependent methyltransferase
LKSGHDLLYEPLLSRAGAYLDTGSTERPLALDIGCGDGRKTKGLRKAGRTLVGVDIGGDYLQEAKSNAPEALYVRCDIEKLPFAGASVDEIFSCSTLHYVDWRQVIGECRRVLKADGKAVFIENLHGNPLVLAYRGTRRLLKWKFATHFTPRAYIEWGELPQFKRLFTEVEYSPFYIFSPLVESIPVLRHRILRRADPSRGRVLSRVTTALFGALSRLDSRLLRLFPRLARYCWMVLIRVKK